MQYLKVLYINITCSIIPYNQLMKNNQVLYQIALQAFKHAPPQLYTQLCNYVSLLHRPRTRLRYHSTRSIQMGKRRTYHSRSCWHHAPPLASLLHAGYLKMLRAFCLSTPIILSKMAHIWKIQLQNTEAPTIMSHSTNIKHSLGMLLSMMKGSSQHLLAVSV